jgi:thiol:disulfide interchange protein
MDRPSGGPNLKPALRDAPSMPPGKAEGDFMIRSGSGTSGPNRLETALDISGSAGSPGNRPGEYDRRRFLGLCLLGTGAAFVGATAPSVAAERNTAITARTVEDYQAALDGLSGRYRAALIDISAEWCAFCQTLENRILPDPDVRRLMEHIGLVKVDVTAMDRKNRDLLRHLRADGPPTLFVVEIASGGEYRGTRSVGAFRKDDLIRRLRPFSEPY